MKIKEYNQMMAYLTREARNPTPRVDFKLAETGRELSKDYADGRLVRPKNIKDKFPKVMFDKSTNKFTAMDPKDNKLVDEIYNSPDPTAAVKKLVKDTAPPDVNTINKELNKYRRPDDQIKTFDNLDPTTYPRSTVKFSAFSSWSPSLTTFILISTEVASPATIT